MALTLRERRRREAEFEISVAALELFEQQGVQATSVSQIAQAAGVSERTVFRYFPRKEDTALVVHAELSRNLRRVIDEIGFAANPLGCLIDACSQVFGEIDEDEGGISQLVLRVDRLIQKEPTLTAAGLRVDVQQSAWLTEQLLAHGYGDKLQAVMLSESIGMRFRVSLQRWSSQHRQGNKVLVVETFLEVLDSFQVLAGDIQRHRPSTRYLL